MPTEDADAMGPTELATSDGRRVRVKAKATEPAEIRITVGTTSAVSPYPSAGYGGHQLTLSKNERYLAVDFSSGQGDNWVELFELQPLRHVKTFQPEQGISSQSAFSSDERLLAMACTVNASLYAGDYGNNDGEFIEEDLKLPWATLEVTDIETEAVSKCDIEVVLRKGEPVEQSEDHYLGNVLNVLDEGVQLHLPWKSPVVVPFPLADLVVEGPSE